MHCGCIWDSGSDVDERQVCLPWLLKRNPRLLPCQLLSPTRNFEPGISYRRMVPCHQSPDFIKEPWQMYDSRNCIPDCSQGWTSALSTFLCIATCNDRVPWLLLFPCCISCFLALTKEKENKNKKTLLLLLKVKHNKTWAWAVDGTQLVERLPSMHEDLGSIPNTA